MRFKKLTFIIGLLFVTILTGCMYPGDQKTAGDIPYMDQIDIVQRAVDAYRENNEGLLPIKTRDLETDIYIKYPIEFSMIVPAYTEKVPTNAYETGGIFQYVLMDVEENPTVKLVDLRMAEKLRDLNLRKSMRNGSVPFKEEVGEGVYAIDYKELGFKEPLTVKSPYSDAYLPLIVGGDGQFYVDYSIDLNRVLQEEKVQVEPGEDIRFILSVDSPVLPAYSLPYTVNEHNEPVYMRR